MRKYLISFVFLFLAGCASTHTVWYNTADSSLKFQEDQDECLNQARQYPSDDEVRQGLSTSYRKANLFIYNRCLNERGWHFREVPDQRH